MSYARCLFLVLATFVILLSGNPLVRGQKTIPDNAGGDGVTVMSLRLYSPNNQSSWIVQTLSPRSENVISVEEAPSDVRFFVFQAHAHLHNISLSYNQTLSPHFHVNGTNLGLVWRNNGAPAKFYVSNRNPQNVSVMFAVVGYSTYAPVPGGCNMEFEIETAPYLKVWYNDVVVKVNAQPAQAPGASCIKDIVTHDMYRMYMPNEDYSEETYFTALQSMLTPRDILANGSLAPNPIYGSLMSRMYSLYTGKGSVYVVLAQTLVGSSAYVPAVSYGCNAISFTNSCSVLTTTFTKVLCACLLFLGFFICFYGHSFFRVELFLCGFLFGSLLAYTGFVQLTSLVSGSILTLSCVVGLSVGAAFVMVWYLSGIPVIAILMTAIPLGFVFASLVFYLGLGDVQAFQLDLNFWLAFLVLTLSLTVVLVPLQHHASMVSCAVLGAYVAGLPFDYYVGGNLRYIVINTLRRASVSGFGLAIIQPPFSGADGAMSLFWLLFAVIGLRVQQIRMARRPPFPPAYRSQPSLALPRPPTARTPLRVSSRIPYGSVGDDDVFETPPAPPGAPGTAASLPLPDSIAGWLGLRGR